RPGALIRTFLRACLTAALSPRRSSRRAGPPGGEALVRLALDHWPHRDAHGRECFLERVELRPQRGLDACSGLIARPPIVAERFDDVIGRYAEVRGSLFDHLQNGMQYPDDGAKRLVLAPG